MQQRRRQQRICFPGYDGTLPKAVRSSRGHGPSKYQAKQKKAANDWGIFELLATVAGEILQERDTDEGTGGSQTDSLQMLESNTLKYLRNFPENPLDVANEEHGRGRTESAKKNHYEISQHLITSNADNFNNNHTAQKVLDEHDTVSLNIDRSSHVVSSNIMETLLNQKYIVRCAPVKGHEEGDTNHNDLKCTSMKGAICSTLRNPIIHDTCHPLVSSASSGEVLTSEEETKLYHEKPSRKSKLTNGDDKHSPEVISPEKVSRLFDISTEGEIRQLGTKRKRFPIIADNISEKPEPGQAIELQYKRKRSISESSEVCTNQGNPNNKAICDSDGKDDSITSSPSEPTNTSWRCTSNMIPELHNAPAIRLSITSFMVPELSIDLPETATVANLKRAVMDTAINLLAGGLHVRVLHEGQKVADENTTLAQMGVTCQESLDSLEFMLEPNCSHNALIKLEDPLPSLSNVTDKPTKSRYALQRGNINIGNRSHANEERSAETRDPAILDEQGAIHQSPNIQPLTIIEPIILHPVLQDTKAMEIVASQQNLQGASTKRRTRTPFTVIEVTALVQAVELLGTGRWREVKQQAFDHATHRTYVDLKDKWKTLVHTAHIAPHQRRGEQVPQDLLDRVLKAHTFWAAQVKQQEAITT